MIRALAFASCFCLGLSPLEAQELDSGMIGARMRVTVRPPAPKKFVGTLYDVGSSTLTVETSKRRVGLARESPA